MVALAPEHRADLVKSGLTDATVSKIHVAGAAPSEAKRHGADSACVFPYFNVDGSVNCFQRMKLFPPVKTDHGTLRYWQPPNTSPHLYLPPLLSWQHVARHPATELTITEGEKKAAAACQHGLITAGIGGVWNWRSTLENGEKLILPMLDEFQWPNRSVLMCPDSDAWHDGKEMQILAGFFALAKELQARGASVLFVRLPDLHGVKAGLDDWLLVPGNDIEHSWPKLGRLALDDGRFHTLTAWWQKWKEKQATRAALLSHDLDDLTLDETAGLYTVRSATYGSVLTFDQLQNQRGSYSAELTVLLGSTVLLDAVKLSLQSDAAQTKHASSLNLSAASVPWKMLVQKACALVLRHKRLGRPSVLISAESRVTPLTYALNPLVFKKKPTILYGDGGLGKSTLGLFCAMLVSTGQQIAGLGALKGRALFLDWEDDEDVHIRRYHAIVAGHPSLAEARVDYQECDEPLPRMLHTLIRRIQADKITFVVVDSLLACNSGDASAEGVSKLFDAIHLLRVECLLLGHVPKAPLEGQQEQTVYGSVFNKNRARCTWEIKKQQEIGDDASILGLFNWKSNHSRLHPALGFKVTQNEHTTSIQYEPFDLSQASELVTALPLHNQIRNLLEDGEPRSSQEIADELGMSKKLRSVKTTLSNPRFKGVKWHMLGENRDAKWTILSR